MPASIVLSDLTLTAPDGRVLLTDVDLSFGSERVGLVGRNGVGKTTLMRLISGELAPQSGTVSVSGVVGVLRQAVQVTPNETVADLFGVTDALALLHRAEVGEATVDELSEADWTLGARMASALGRVELEAELETPLVALSGGQRTRAGLAALIFAEPDILLLDEPTNNLDRMGRKAVVDLIAGWRGGAVVVSHDRELLETMDAIVELTTLGATRYGGNWSAYRARKALELAAAQRDLADAERRITDLARTAQLTAERKARKDRAGRRKAAKDDMPRIAAGAWKDRSEATGGNSDRSVESRRKDALEAADQVRERIEVLQPLTVVLPPTNLPAGKTVLKIDAVTAGYTSGRPVIHDVSLTMIGPERVAITGPNGSGKTTLLALISGEMQPWTGTVQVPVKAAILDQRVSLLEPSASIRDNFRRLNPEGDENACRAALARFMFRADAALTIVSSLSGGQLLRAGLACVLGGAMPPQLLILDEPTNHLDIGSVESVEAGLRAYDGALLVVSHDEEFLKLIGISRRLELASRGSLPSKPKSL